jgi:hypothetical protein
MGMSRLQSAWRVVRGIAAGAIVVVHTLAIIGGAINRLAAGPEFNLIDRAAGSILTATGTIQRWHMFSPNVGDASFCPVLVLTLDDPKGQGGRRQVVLPSETTPPLPWLADERYLKPNLSVQERMMKWQGHFGDARRRKLETRVIDPVAGEWEQGTSYARWVLRDFMDRNPELAPHIRKADLYVAIVRHYGAKTLPVREDCYLVRVYPQTDPLWPQGVSTSVLTDPPPRKVRTYP